MLLSILHRITGLALSAGLIVFTFGLVNAASGPEQYQAFRAAMSSTGGLVVLVGLSFAFFLHLANGVRHLVWDTGRGFGKGESRASAWFALVFAAVLTGGLWALAL